MKTIGKHDKEQDGGAEVHEHIYATRAAAPQMDHDPVCQMQVTPDSPHRLEHNGTTYSFCTARCLEKFRQWPERYVHGAPVKPA